MLKEDGLLDRYRKRLEISAAEGNAFIRENIQTILDIYQTPSVIPEFYLNSYVEHLWDNKDKIEFIQTELERILNRSPHYNSDYAIAKNFISMYEEDPEHFKHAGFSMKLLKQCVTLME
jgi:uncharacterized protein YqgQ